MTTDPYAAAVASAARLAELTGEPRHDVAVVLGSGWAEAADALGEPGAQVPVAELGGFAEPTVPGHLPVVRSVQAGPLTALVFLGRSHLYEGHSPAAVVHGVRTALAAGCRTVVLTNAAGGIQGGLAPGQPVLISDQLNLTGQSPLAGPPPPGGYPSRFTDLSRLYSARLRAVARAAAPDLAEAVYAGLAGPQYETPAEIRMLRGLGAGLVGMSTVLEAIAARHLGAEVLGISLVTNIAAGLSGQPVDHGEVVATGRQAADRLGALLASILPAALADMFTEDLREQARAWTADDPDDQDRAAAGPNRMNSATVTATTAAVASWVMGRDPGAADAGVVVGCDARHRSEEFAALAGRVIAGAGIRVHMLPGHEPTPFLSFSVRYLRAAAGVMITASHNQAADNGYKVYLSDGAQIAPPADTDIAAAIAGLGPLSAVPVAPPDSPLISWHGEEATQAYLDAICAEIGPAPASAAWLRFVYTPLNGVAGRLALRAFAQAGYAAPDVVGAQFDPDPDFPTVTFPNPEEPGALDLALAQARRSGADLVLASDPDGGRLAVAVPDPDAPGGYRQLTGDQVGALLGRFLLGRLSAEPGTVMSEQLVVSTVGSSSLLAKIAAAAGAQHAQTLSGFEWLVRAADLRDDVRFAFGYSEALGYAVTEAVRDKDAIGAALAVLSLATVALSAGESLQHAYDALEVEHGVHLTARLTRTTATTVDVMSRLRAAAPAELAGQPVLSVTDYSGGSWDLHSADMLSYQLPGARVVVRPSGTEPKIEAYLEVVQPVPGARLQPARAAAAERMAALTEAVLALLAS